MYIFWVFCSFTCQYETFDIIDLESSFSVQGYIFVSESLFVHQGNWIKVRVGYSSWCEGKSFRTDQCGWCCLCLAKRQSVLSCLLLSIVICKELSTHSELFLCACGCSCVMENPLSSEPFHLLWHLCLRPTLACRC